MLNKILTSLSLRSDANPYTHLPEQLQDEIKAANEATTVYDIR